MAYIPRSSLIPNESSSAIPAQMKKRRTIHVFGLLAMLIFILSLLGAVGIFVYKDFLGKQLTAAKDGLSAASSENSRNMIEEIRVYDEKLKVAKNLLDNHIAPSHIFEEIESFTKSTVQFRSLEFVYDPGFDAMLTLSGNTEEFSSLALQKMQILEDNVFSEFVLQGIATSKEVEDETEEESTVREGVTFTVVGIFEKNLIKYDPETLNEENAPAEVIPEETDVPLEATEAPIESPVENPFSEGNTTP